MRLSVALALGLCLAWIPRIAAAGPGREKVAVAVWNVSGEPVPEEMQAKMRSELYNGLRTGFDVVDEPELQQAIKSAGIVGCDTIACMRRIGEVLFVRRVVTANIESKGPSNVTTKVALIDLSSGKPLVSTEDECKSCNFKEVYEGISNAAASLKPKLDALETPPPPVPGATPPVDQGPAYRRSVPLLAAGGVATALGLGGIVVGIVEASRNEDVCGAIPAGGVCVRHRDTTNGMLFGFITGVPLLVAGIVMTYYGAHYPVKRAHASLMPSTVGASGLGWSF